jgi:hypothetical protein
MKVPAIIASSVICLLIGLGAGVLGMTYYGPITLPSWLGGPPDRTAEVDPNAPPGPVGMGAPKGKGDKGGMPKGPSPKAQLAGLVAKLDTLTQKPLTVTLTAEQKKQVQENLKGLDDVDALRDEDAQKHLDGLVAALKEHKDTFEAAGFRWPGSPLGGGPPLGMIPNPFKVAPSSTQLHAVRERLDPVTP